MRKSLCLPFLVIGLMVGEFGCGSGSKIPRESTRVEIFRVGTELARPSDGAAIGGYPLLATAKEQGPDFAARLSKILRTKGVTPNRKKCGLELGVAYRLWNGDKAVEVLVCFKCDVLWPHVVGEEVMPSHREWKDFDPVRPELLALTKEAFPEDTEIQCLPEHRNKGG